VKVNSPSKSSTQGHWPETSDLNHWVVCQESQDLTYTVPFCFFTYKKRFFYCLIIVGLFGMLKTILWIAIRSIVIWFRDCNECITCWWTEQAKWWGLLWQIFLWVLHCICRNVMIKRDGRTDVIRQAAECLPSDFLVRKQFSVVLILNVTTDWTA